MNRIFGKIGQSIEKSPIKTLLIFILVFAIMIAGAINVYMATGNDTLVDSKNEVYIQNYIMEDNFGGEAIMVLFQGEKDQLLQIDNLEKIWQIEKQLSYNEDIFSIMSPSSIVNQISDKQAKEFKKQVLNISDGLKQMSDKLVEIGGELGNKEMPDPKEIENKLDELMASMDPDSLMKDMLKDQEKEMAKIDDQVSLMARGLGDMGDKLINMSSDLAKKDLPNPKDLEKKLDDLLLKMSPDTLMKNMAGSLDQSASKVIADMMSNMEEEVLLMKSNLSGGIDPEELKTMAGGLGEMGGRLKELSMGLSDLPKKMNSMMSNSQDPSALFAGMMSDLETEVGGMMSNLSGGIDPDELKTMAAGFVTMGENLMDISEGLATFNSKSGMMSANMPDNKADLEDILYDENEELRDVFNDVIIDDNNNVMMIKLQGNLEDEKKDLVYEEVESALEKQDFSDIEYIISGKPVLDSSLRDEMKTNMKYMIASAVVLMFIILMLVFKIRWRALSLAIIFTSVIGTLGLMGHLSVPMTMVSMAVFPILIGLGIDYSIQFQNRYEEEKSTKTTLQQIGKAVGIAVLATVLGFMSLYASPVPMIQDFGKMLTIGVIVSFLGSIFLLMPILTARDTLESPHAQKEYKFIYSQPTIIDKILKSSTLFISKHKLLVIILAIVLAGFGLFADTKVGVETDIETFMPQDMEALADIHLIRDIVGSTNQMAILLEGENLLSKENIDWTRAAIKDMEDKFPEKIVDIKSIDNLVSNIEDPEGLTHSEYLDIVEDFPESQRKMFINTEQDKAVVLMNIEHMPTEDLQDFVLNIEEIIKDSPMKLSITGKSALDVEMVKGLTEGRVQMTLLGIGLVFLALVLIYRNIFKAFSAIFPIILIVGMSGGIMYILGLKYTPITATLGALILGMGTEMTIILLERYLEERKLGKEKLDAILLAVNKVGKATVASGLTTVGGFSVLMLSKFVILKDFGLMTVINISLALLSTFIILPAIILLMDKFLFSKKEKEEYKIS